MELFDLVFIAVFLGSTVVWIRVLFFVIGGRDVGGWNARGPVGSRHGRISRDRHHHLTAGAGGSF